MTFLKPFFIFITCIIGKHINSKAMQTRKIAFLFLVLLGAFLLHACEYEKVQPEPVTETVSYSQDIQPIFNSSCALSGCHAGNVSPNLTEGQSYDALMNGGFVNLDAPNQSKIYTEMAPGGGMSAYTNANAANTVLAWIQQGAPNN
jgi:hypothetical protein